MKSRWSLFLVLTALILGAGVGLGPAGRAAAILPEGIRILDPSQILSERTVTRSQDLYFQDSQGTLRRFLTSTSDPEILNHGDGSFHPASAAVVEQAIESIDPRFVDLLRFETCILPYPVADPIGSWADDGSIYICPGVYELSDVNIHFLMSHETGHLVHRAFLADTDREGWARYRAIRGIADTTRFNAFAAHRDRPHEIFAEDFRILFGSDLARNAGGIENPDLQDPRSVPGLREFYLSLIRTGVAADARPVALLFPNPLGRGDVLHFAQPQISGSADLALFDVTGRQVRAIRGLVPDAGGIYKTAWDGLDDAGRALPLGAYYGVIRSTAGNGASAHYSLRLVR